MTMQSVLEGVVPAWTRGDCLRKARTHAGFTVKQLSEATGISEKTINNYEGDKVTPRRPSMIAWALATGVSLDWLERGGIPPTDGPPADAFSGTRRYSTTLRAVA